MLITFYRSDSSDEVHFYSIHDRQPSLFGDHAFTVIWGRALRRGREKVYTFSTREELDDKLRELISTRIREGYRVLYSYFRKGEYQQIRSAIKHVQAS
ncbi:MAG: WGR domain-containing protein [Spirochaetaceae bacterium]